MKRDYSGMVLLHHILNFKSPSDKPYFNGNIFEYILGVCETCDEALNIFNRYNMKIFDRAQILMWRSIW